MGKRVNLADLAGEPLAVDARPPARPDGSPTAVRLADVAPNPLNTRDPESEPTRLHALIDSIRMHGQIQPCTVVLRAAFLAIFPEHAPDLPTGAVYVQVTGGRRRAALAQLDRPMVDVIVKDGLAATRVGFLAATAAENIDRQDYDLIEEARAVERVAAETGSGKAAAEQFGRTPGWVSQRLNLLKLDPALQAALRAGDMPLREARNLHTSTRAEQMAALAAWRRIAAHRQRADDERLGAASERSPGENGAPRRSSTTAAAIRRLGATPAKIALALRSEMTDEDLRQLAHTILEAVGEAASSLPADR